MIGPIKIFQLSLVFVVLAAAGNHFWRGKTLSTKETKAKWGASEFDQMKFKSGSLKVRASMAADLLAREKQFVGQPITDIKVMLGDPDGFYFSDAFAAYLIQEASSKTEESWQIVFLVDNNRLVSGLIVHKNCCD